MKLFGRVRSLKGLRTTFAASVAVLAFLAPGWSREGVGKVSRKPPENRFATIGEPVWITAFTATPAGAVWKIRDSGTPLDGVDVYVEPGSLGRPSKFNVGLNTGRVNLPGRGTSKNPIIQIGIESQGRLARPMRISIPVKEGCGAGPISGLRVNDDGSLSSLVVAPAALDADNVRRFGLYVSDSGLFTWVEECL